MTESSGNEQRLPAKIERLLANWELPQKTEADWAAMAAGVEQRIATLKPGRGDGDEWLFQPPLPLVNGEQRSWHEHSLSANLLEIPDAQGTAEGRRGRSGNDLGAEEDRASGVRSSDHRSLRDIAKEALAHGSAPKASVLNTSVRKPAESGVQLSPPRAPLAFTQPGGFIQPGGFTQPGGFIQPGAERNKVVRLATNPRRAASAPTSDASSTSSANTSRVAAAHSASAHSASAHSASAHSATAASTQVLAPSSNDASSAIHDSKLHKGTWLWLAGGVAAAAAVFALFIQGQPTPTTVSGEAAINEAARGAADAPLVTPAEVVAQSPRAGNGAQDSELASANGNEPATPTADSSLAAGSSPAADSSLAAALPAADSLPGSSGADASGAARRPTAQRAAGKGAAAKTEPPAGAMAAESAGENAEAEPVLVPAAELGTHPAHPSVGAAQAAIGTALGSARLCVVGQLAPSQATVTFGSNGYVMSVAVSGPAAGTPAEACIQKTMGRARVRPFTDTTFSVKTTVRP